MARSRFYRSWLTAAALVAASPAFAQFGSIFRDDGPPRPPANVPEAPPYYSPQRQSPPSQQPYYPSRGDVPPPPVTGVNAVAAWFCVSAAEAIDCVAVTALLTT